jgi:arabinofuranosyltransferase
LRETASNNGHAFGGWWAPLLLALALVLLGILAALYLPAFEPESALHAEGLDDAYISYRYALNLVGGEGLVYNPGERLEGYSNLLWVLAAALLLQVAAPENLHAAVTGLNALLAAAALLVFHAEMRRRAGGFAAAAAAACWAFYPFLWPWIGSGLESLAMVLLQLLVWRRLARWELSGQGEGPAWGELALWLSLAALLRADGFVLAALAAGHFLLAGQPGRALRTILLGAPATLAVFAFRLYYFDDLWPSTYYVKVTRGLFERLFSAFGQLGELAGYYLLAPFLAALAWELWRSRADLRHLAPELTLGGGLLAYWLYVGGDVFKVRFLLVLVPFGLAVIFGSYARGLERRHVGGLAALLLAAYAGIASSLPDFRWQHDRYDAWIELGRFLGRQHPGALLASDGAGKVPYFSGLRTIDMLGLCDAHISKLPPSRKERPGHEKSDPAYVLGRRPDLIAGYLWPSLKVSPDLDGELYRAAGYHIAYLVNIEPGGLANSILPAPAAAGDYPLLLAQGYRYAVLARAAPP